MSATAIPSKKKSDPLDWAEHLIWMEGGEMPSTPAVDTVPERIPSLWPGVLCAVALAAVATVLSGLSFFPFQLASGVHPFDPILLGILLGIIVGNVLPVSRRLSHGIQWSAKKLLPAGVVFLGARLHFGDVLSVGAFGLLASLLVVLGAFAAFCLLMRPLKVDSVTGWLLATGTAICGGTAIVAVAPLLKAKREQVVIGVATVTLLGLIAMFILPWLANALELTARQYGLWAGLTIHQTPQVIAAGFAHSEEAGQIATIVKLARVCLLAPVAVVMGILVERSENHHAASTKQTEKMTWRRALKFVPLFLLGFLAMALCRTLGLFPEATFSWQGLPWAETASVETSLSDVFKMIAGFLLATAMVGVGLETRLKSLANISARPFLAAGIVSLLIAIAVPVVLHLTA